MSSSDISSDFGEMVEEFPMDENDNPILPKGAVRTDGKTGVSKEPKNPELTLEERRKQKRLEKLDKKIKSVTKKHDKEKSIKIQNPTDIRNKHKRQEVVLLKKMENRREAKIEKLKKQKIREEHGEDAAPKGITKTIESMRVKDETIITDAEDDEIRGEQSIDEFSKYFQGETTPRILMTTNRRPRGKIFDFMKEIKASIPGCEYYERKNFQIRGVIKEAIK